METARTDADSAKTSLLGVQSEIRKLQSERDSMLAKMQSAQARIKVQEQLDGLSVDAEVKALDNVRQHIKTTIAEANLGKELSESSLDSRLAALRNQTGEVQAKVQGSLARPYDVTIGLAVFSERSGPRRRSRCRNRRCPVPSCSPVRSRPNSKTCSLQRVLRCSRAPPKEEGRIG